MRRSKKKLRLSDQCDQIAILSFNLVNLVNETNEKTYLKTFKILPKSQNFSKYGHTVSDAKFASKFHPESKVIRLPRMEPLK